MEDRSPPGKRTPGALAICVLAAKRNVYSPCDNLGKMVMKLRVTSGVRRIAMACSRLRTGDAHRQLTGSVRIHRAIQRVVLRGVEFCLWAGHSCQWKSLAQRQAAEGRSRLHWRCCDGTESDHPTRPC